MHLGLIGGIGPAATDFYYRRLIAAFAARNADLQLTIVHADAPTLLHNLATGNVAGQVAIYQRLANRLAAAGADCLAITSIAGHFCIDALKPVSPLTVIDMIEEVSLAIRQMGYRRLGILGTRTVMETRFYGSLPQVTIIPPNDQHLHEVHQAYSAMAIAGFATAAQSATFHAAAQSLLQDERVEAILLGGTDLALIFDPATSEIPVIDCAAIHADALAALAMPGRSP
ncbi:MAG: aspartate/glutamate racemase family protein [Sphingorhabdus sp.]|uniref:aspartate/glutamate racemase family protein n=1 Tax=Sphingorhabdus sp. TaxID=1902408 RepID=UPI003C963161